MNIFYRGHTRKEKEHLTIMLAFYVEHFFNNQFIFLKMIKSSGAFFKKRESVT
ncbi:hypothetical protein [Liquorilactobacillus satsumensis]|uniref:Uncharacterized protein n=1 Tax=Liquorilactobacillus satsumensis DSM 16230 = JCM 12392 TaxID=1423801 RepID=A0A0R1V1L8_9LACO|nr:hypothetical protein FD50_GL000101 [Liquorilactobacillus satsumensis DSM 16230 = JCM 12392]